MQITLHLLCSNDDFNGLNEIPIPVSLGDENLHRNTNPNDLNDINKELHVVSATDK